MARFYLAQFAAAQKDFAAETSSAFSVIWLYLAQARAGQQAQDELAKNAAKLNLKGWSTQVINLFLGKATPVAVPAAAKTSDAKKDRERHCQAYFYLGQRALLQGKQNDAKRLFQQAVETRLTASEEYRGPQAELQRLSASPAPPH
ncbi:MAG: hypothetical protein WAO35_00560 [Terriglobia bacterium]